MLYGMALLGHRTLQTIIPLLPSSQMNFTAMSGDKVVLLCPVQPGALLQQYSVRWKKDNSAITDYDPWSVLTAIDSRYNINRANYSLIINSVTINDTSADYKCELRVMNPSTHTLQKLQPSSPALVSLSLKVIGKFCYLIFTLSLCKACILLHAYYILKCWRGARE